MYPTRKKRLEDEQKLMDMFAMDSFESLLETFDVSKQDKLHLFSGKDEWVQRKVHLEDLPHVHSLNFGNKVLNLWSDLIKYQEEPDDSVVTTSYMLKWPVPFRIAAVHQQIAGKKREYEVDRSTNVERTIQMYENDFALLITDPSIRIERVTDEEERVTGSAVYGLDGSLKEFSVAVAIGSEKAAERAVYTEPEDTIKHLEKLKELMGEGILVFEFEPEQQRLRLNQQPYIGFGHLLGDKKDKRRIAPEEERVLKLDYPREARDDGKGSWVYEFGILNRAYSRVVPKRVDPILELKNINARLLEGVE